MATRANPIRLVCQACGASPPPLALFPHRCPEVEKRTQNNENEAGPPDLRDHLLVRQLNLEGTRETAAHFPRAPFASKQPFVRYRELLHAHGLARSYGVSDEHFVALVERLDAEVQAVTGRGFEITPCARSRELEQALLPRGEIWVKDETVNVSGSHKGRHLFGLLLHLELARQLGDKSPDHPLAIASCGNAALAAAAVARAGQRQLQVFVPPDADPEILSQIRSLGASIEVCPRDKNQLGDPCMGRLDEAIRKGAVPFTVQGRINGLTFEGGLTLAYELVQSMIEKGRPFDRIFVQVGGGALASSLCLGLCEAVALGAIPHLPKIHAVQTEGAHPLERAYGRLTKLPLPPDKQLQRAAENRREFMWPWETPPQSCAHGILDDETYDWLPIASGMMKSEGGPLVVNETQLLLAEEMAQSVESVKAEVDATGAAGLAGLLHVLERGEIDPDESVAVLFTGARQTGSQPPGKVEEAP